MIYTKENSRCIPAHPFTYKCKGSDEVVAIDPEEIYRLASENNTEALKSIIQKTLSMPCRINGTEIYGAVAVFKNLFYREGSTYMDCGGPSTVTIDMVAINKARRSSEKEMIYTYEAVVEGTRYYMYLLSYGESLTKTLEEAGIIMDKPTEFHLGRGTSRGYGLTEVTFRNRNQLLEKLENLYRESVYESRSLVLYTLSPVWAPHSHGLPEFSEYEKVKLEKAYYTATTVYKGWSNLTNTPTPLVRALAPGSVIVYRVEDPEDTPKTLGELNILTQRYGGPGTNFMIPIQGLNHILSS